MGNVTGFDVPDLSDDPQGFLLAFRNAERVDLGRKLFESGDMRLAGEEPWAEVGLHAALELEIRNAAKHERESTVRELRDLQDRLVTERVGEDEWSFLRSLVGGWLQTADPEGGW